MDISRSCVRDIFITGYLVEHGRLSAVYFWLSGNFRLVVFGLTVF